ALGVELDGLLRAHRQVADQHVGAGLADRRDDVDRLLVGLVDRLPVVLAQAVVGVAALHGHAQRRDVGDLDGVVLAGDDRFRQVAADLLGVDVERGDELNVADVVFAEPHVHQAGHGRRLVGVPVVVHALHERGGAVADADDGDLDGSHELPFFLTTRVRTWTGAVLAMTADGAGGPVYSGRVGRLLDTLPLAVDQFVEPADLAV